MTLGHRIVLATRAPKEVNNKVQKDLHYVDRDCLESVLGRAARVDLRLTDALSIFAPSCSPRKIFVQ